MIDHVATTFLAGNGAARASSSSSSSSSVARARAPLSDSFLPPENSDIYLQLHQHGINDSAGDHYVEQEGGPFSSAPEILPRPVNRRYWHDKYAAIVDPESKGRFSVKSKRPMDLRQLLFWWERSGKTEADEEKSGHPSGIPDELQSIGSFGNAAKFEQLRRETRTMSEARSVGAGHRQKSYKGQHENKIYRNDFALVKMMREQNQVAPQDDTSTTPVRGDVSVTRTPLAQMTASSGSSSRGDSDLVAEGRTRTGGMFEHPHSGTSQLLDVNNTTPQTVFLSPSPSRGPVHMKTRAGKAAVTTPLTVLPPHLQLHLVGKNKDHVAVEQDEDFSPTSRSSIAMQKTTLLSEVLDDEAGKVVVLVDESETDEKEKATTSKPKPVPKFVLKKRSSSKRSSKTTSSRASSACDNPLQVHRNGSHVGEEQYHSQLRRPTIPKAAEGNIKLEGIAELRTECEEPEDHHDEDDENSVLIASPVLERLVGEKHNKDEKNNAKQQQERHQHLLGHESAQQRQKLRNNTDEMKLKGKERPDVDVALDPRAGGAFFVHEGFPWTSSMMNQKEQKHQQDEDHNAHEWSSSLSEAAARLAGSAKLLLSHSTFPSVPRVGANISTSKTITQGVRTGGSGRQEVQQNFSFYPEATSQQREQIGGMIGSSPPSQSDAVPMFEHFQFGSSKESINAYQRKHQPGGAGNTTNNTNYTPGGSKELQLLSDEKLEEMLNNLPLDDRAASYYRRMNSDSSSIASEDASGPTESQKVRKSKSSRRFEKAFYHDVETGDDVVASLDDQLHVDLHLPPLDESRRHGKKRSKKEKMRRADLMHAKSRGLLDYVQDDAEMKTRRSAILGAFPTVSSCTPSDDHVSNTASKRSSKSKSNDVEQNFRSSKTTSKNYLYYPSSAAYQEQQREAPLPPNMYRPAIPRNHAAQLLPDNDFANLQRDGLLAQLARKNEVLVHGVADLTGVLRAIASQLPYLPTVVSQFMGKENRGLPPALFQQSVALAHAVHAFWIHQNALIYLLEDRAVLLRQMCLAEVRLRQIERDHRWLIRGLHEEVFGEKRSAACVQRAQEFSKLLHFRDRMKFRLQGLKDKDQDLRHAFLNAEAATRLEIRHALLFLERCVYAGLIPQTQVAINTEREVSLLVKKGQLLMMLVHLLEEVIAVRVEYMDREEIITGQNGALSVQERQPDRGYSITKYLRSSNQGRLRYVADADHVFDRDMKLAIGKSNRIPLEHWHGKREVLGEIFSRPLPHKSETKLIEKELAEMQKLAKPLETMPLAPWLSKAMKHRIKDLETLLQASRRAEIDKLDKDAVDTEQLWEFGADPQGGMQKAIREGLEKVKLNPGLTVALAQEHEEEDLMAMSRVYRDEDEEESSEYYSEEEEDEDEDYESGYESKSGASKSGVSGGSSSSGSGDSAHPTSVSALSTIASQLQSKYNSQAASKTSKAKKPGSEDDSDEDSDDDSDEDDSGSDEDDDDESGSDEDSDDDDDDDVDGSSSS
ncbi:unnamed protein product [Amoebophrya sp. A120]|nr:unnamed protein product [Amoebophrya sp. A120]|eukprot:GSA120T00016702001.1